MEGRLLVSEGPRTEPLMRKGLLPAVGDVILRVGDDMVTQLDQPQLQRLIGRRRELALQCGVPLRISFRRHNVSDVEVLS